jgi:DNA-binding transcriptional MerR regulator
MPATSAPLSDQSSASGPPAGEARVKYRIEQVAERLRTTRRTLRYYEEIGLLLPAERTEGGYRLYSEEDIARLERIQRLKDLLGFSLAEIRALLHADDERSLVRVAFRQEHDPATKMKYLDEFDRLNQGQLAVVERKMTGLEQMRQEILQRLEHAEAHRRELQAQLEQPATGAEQPTA